MESKEAMRVIDKFGIELPVGCAGEIINLIRELQKYKDMFEEIEDYLEPGMIVEIPEGMALKSSRHIDIIKHIIKRIKEKYFPESEPIKKTMIIEIEANNKDVLKGEMNFLKAFLERNKDVLQCKYKIREEKK